MPTPPFSVPESHNPNTPPESAREVFGAQLPLVQRYANFVADAGYQRGLIGPREIPRLWERHLLNCAVISDQFPQHARVVDIGSGAGLPGLVLACHRTDLEVDLVESMQRRVDFLSEAVTLLELGDRVRVIHGRAEDKAVQRQVGDTQWVTARAVAPLDKLARWALGLLAPQGRLIAMKGKTAEAEIEQYRSVIAHAGGRVVGLEQCGTPNEPVRVVVVERVGRTASRAVTREMT